jgi:hypothetical protein
MKSTVNAELIATVNSALKNAEAMEIFKENLLSFTNVLQQGKFKLTSYISAVKYVGFKIMGATNKEAYVKTFPDKYQQFLKEGVSEKDISSYITAYNKGKLVNLIFAQSQIPTHILNAPLFQQAINTQASLMLNAKSEMVRMQAANSLLIHLKPPEVVKMELDIGVTHNSIIDDYEVVMRRMVEKQKELIAAGGDLKQIANASIKPLADEIIEMEPEPEKVPVVIPKAPSIFA